MGNHVSPYVNQAVARGLEYIRPLVRVELDGGYSGAFGQEGETDAERDVILADVQAALDWIDKVMALRPTKEKR